LDEPEVPVRPEYHQKHHPIHSLISDYLPKKEQVPKAKHFPTKFYINLIHDTNAYLPEQVLPQMGKLMDNLRIEERLYDPIIDVEQFWLRDKELVDLDDQKLLDSEVLNCTFQFNIYWSYKYLMENQYRNYTGLYE